MNYYFEELDNGCTKYYLTDDKWVVMHYDSLIEISDHDDDELHELIKYLRAEVKIHRRIASSNRIIRNNAVFAMGVSMIVISSILAFIYGYIPYQWIYPALIVSGIITCFSIGHDKEYK